MPGLLHFFKNSARALKCQKCAMKNCKKNCVTCHHYKICNQYNKEIINPKETKSDVL